MIQSKTPLTGAGRIGGGSYLPIRSVFAALGATVTNAGSSWNIQYGDTKIQLQKGSATASVNGLDVALKGKVQTLDGQAVFPADGRSGRCRQLGCQAPAGRHRVRSCYAADRIQRNRSA
nr:copper amine oxidase N-terminal domain-containing protein [Saccharibacillus deserti]